MQKNDYKSTALERGIKVLSILNFRESTLSELSSSTSIPGATLVRLLSTLQKLGLVEKIPNTKRYKSTWVLVPKNTSDKYRSYISECLRGIVKLTGLTAEWYMPCNERMVISDRCDSDSPINVRAKIGYSRVLNDELEAVTKIALSCEDITKINLGSYWHWNDGTISVITPEELHKSVNETKESGTALDKEYNIFGIRRYAARVLDPDNNLFGIIALAEGYSPNAQKREEFNLNTLKTMAEDIERKIRKLKIKGE